jgi:acetyltransferase-like isoleucine patch superfamily enzyme/acyl carrier protein
LITDAIASVRRKPVREIWTALDAFARARVMLRGIRRGERIRCYGRVLVEGRSGIEIGERAVFLKGMLPTELRCAEGAELVIGPKTMFNYGVSIVSQRSIRIGARCRFGSLVQIRDDDGRRTHPIVIGNDVWVAHGAMLEPGAVVGDGSVVAAGAVLSTVVPPGMLAFGNPARTFPLERTRGGITAIEPPMTRQSHVRLAFEVEESGASSEIRGVSREADAAATSAAPSRDEVRAVIIEWLDDTRHFGEAANLIQGDDMSLREGGILDSLGLVDLVLMLEQRFEIDINRELVTRPENQTLCHFLDLVTMPSSRSFGASE